MVINYKCCVIRKDSNLLHETYGIVENQLSRILELITYAFKIIYISW
jgi:hypothetical protein